MGLFIDCDVVFLKISKMSRLQIKVNMCVQHDFVKTGKMFGKYKRFILEKTGPWSLGLLTPGRKISVDRVNNPNHDGAFFHGLIGYMTMRNYTCDWNGWSDGADGRWYLQCPPQKGDMV